MTPPSPEERARTAVLGCRHWPTRNGEPHRACYDCVLEVIHGVLHDDRAQRDRI